MDAKALTPSQKSSIHVKSPQFKILKTSLDVDICSAPMAGISLIQPPACRDVFCVFLKMFLQKIILPFMLDIEPYLCLVTSCFPASF